ncbi:MAG: PKD domain-containing protein [Bacteroidia bacterium]
MKFKFYKKFNSSFCYHFRKHSVFAAFSLIMMCSNVRLFAQTFPSNFSPSLFMGGWNSVEGFRFDLTGQMYVWEKDGRVWVVDTNGIKITPALLDISEEVGGWRDHGLNGFVLDPNFRTNGYFYLEYTVDRHYLMKYGTGNYNATTNEYYNATIIRVTRYTANAATNFTTTIAGSRLVLIGETRKTGIPLLHESHSGGQLAFGTDGSLLLTTGDGASYNVTDVGSSSDTYWSQGLTDSIIRPKENVGAFRSQMVDCLNGKLLRIDPATGDGLPTNPYYDPSNPRSAKSRVWCLGLRNPFRMTFKTGTGTTDITAGNPGIFYIGDVGWGTFEDVNVAYGPGLNFGWPKFEGLTIHSGYQASTVYNQDAPNPLYGVGGCTQQYFQFKELLIQDTLTSNPSWRNPCNSSQQIPSTLYRFKHARPAIDYQHGSSHARTGIWNGTSASQIDLNQSGSPVPGPVFPGNAAAGSAWYTGTKYPVVYQNTYFQADYGQSWIKNIKFKANNITPDSVKTFGDNLGPVVFIEYNPKDQWLYYVQYPSNIYKLTYNISVNNPPTAVASQDAIYGMKPLVVNFTGSNSTDPENQALTYSWNFGDGTANSASANTFHTFNPLTNNPVAFTVTLTVTDNIGQTSVKTLKVYVNDTPPVVSITSFNNGDLFTMSHLTNKLLQASVFDSESPDHDLSYSWTTFLHHNNHEHPESSDTNRVTTTVISPVGCDGNTYYYRIELTVKDPIGLATTVQGILYPACDPPVPDFSGNITTGCPGQQVNFTDSSSNLPDSWSWSFPGGNPSASTLQNPSVLYPTGGTYDVSLTATSTRGSNSTTKSGYIIINVRPNASISPSGIDSVCSNQQVLLSANVGASLGYQWIKGGVEIAGATNQTYNAVNSGKYNVRVTRTTTGCNRTSSAKKVVYRTVPAVITPGGPTVFCAGDSVVLSANAGAFTYQWKKHTSDIPNATDINYTAKTGGNYKVKVTDAFGCTKVSSTVAVTINCKLIDSENESKSAFGAVISPNPVHGNAVLKISMPSNETISIKIYDAIGKEINVLIENLIMNKGENEVKFDASTFPSGIYFVKISYGVQSKTLKLMVGIRE